MCINSFVFPLFSHIQINALYTCYLPHINDIRDESKEQIHMNLMFWNTLKYILEPVLSTHLSF